MNVWGCALDSGWDFPDKGRSCSSATARPEEGEDRPEPGQDAVTNRLSDCSLSLLDDFNETEMFVLGERTSFSD